MTYQFGGQNFFLVKVDVAELSPQDQQQCIADAEVVLRTGVSGE